MFLSCTGLPALGQEAGMNAPAYAAIKAPPPKMEILTSTDKYQDSGNLAASLSKRLVLFESRRDADHKRVGIPFTAFAGSPFHLAYDPAGHQMMAQWTSSSRGLGGVRQQYQTYLDASGMLSFVFNARF